MSRYFLLFCLLPILSITAQTTKKELQASRIQEAPVIDGKLDDKAWEGAAIAKDFVMFRPGDGDPERQNQKTESS